ncbi:hypothetical protein [Kitasatospora sp. LaBMicrA B282]|uniref:hypothetical protein n=1 Tax=Kitasatospora sp. LaBMicrA B282 TaxID=3420949 RepID=UPI003D13C3D5
MTTTAISHAELAKWLVEASQAVSGIVTAEHTAPPTCSYLGPVLGSLAAGPQVITTLALRLEGLLAEEPSPAVLFTLASYASALGWLTESLSDLTQVISLLCAQAGIPADGAEATAPREVANFDLSAYAPQDWQAITDLAAAAALPPGLYLEILGQALLAGASFTEACTEITGALSKDAHRLLDEPAASFSLVGEGPDSLPTLVRSLLTRLEADQ